MLHRKTATVVIAALGTASTVLDQTQLRYVRNFTIYPPATLDSTRTFNIEVSPVNGSASVAGDWRYLQSGGDTINLVQDAACFVAGAPFYGLRIASTGTVDSARTFTFVLNEEVS